MKIQNLFRFILLPKKKNTSSLRLWRFFRKMHNYQNISNEIHGAVRRIYLNNLIS